jgi:hypothetical protein
MSYRSALNPSSQGFSSTLILALHALKPPTKPSSCLPRLAVGAKRFAELSQTEGVMARTQKSLCRSQPREPRGAHLTHAVRTFSTTEAREQALAASSGHKGWLGFGTRQER